MEEKRICKNCGGKIIRRETRKTPEQLKKSFYYSAYDFCTKCKRLYHNEKFKVVNAPEQSLFPPLSSKNKNYDVEIWTDGACTRNGYENAKAAWGFVAARLPSLRLGVSGQGKIERAGLVVGKQTNNTAEGYAIYHALLWAAEENHKKIKIYSDSQISLNNLKKSPDKVKENREIFQLIEDVIAANNLIVDYEKVLGHSGDVNNERADALANGLAMST